MNQELKFIALKTKENSKVLTIIGFFFFISSILFGAIWFLSPDNNKLEPATFLLSIFATIFFGLPQFAEFILPKRKPIKDMTYDDIMDFIITTDSKKDWNGISKDWVSEKFLIEDPRLRFRAKFIDDGVQNENFIETWANSHPDSSATGYWYDLYYSGNLIDRFLLVSIDGGRALLAPPEPLTTTVNKLNYKVAEIHDTINSLESYMKRAKLTT